MRRFTDRPSSGFFLALLRADRRLALLWYGLLVVQGLLPTVFAVATGALAGAVSDHASLVPSLIVIGVVFLVLQVVAPLLSVVSANLGNRTSAWLYDRLTQACIEPAGLGHLEDPELADDLTVARDFDLGMTGPPMNVNVDFIAASLGQMLAGLAATLTLFGLAWWAPPLVGGAWLSTHYLLRESSVWRDRNTQEVRSAQRDADYAYRMAVDPPSAKELRCSASGRGRSNASVRAADGCTTWQYAATKLRERSVLLSVVLVAVANVAFFWLLSREHLSLDRTVVYAQLAVAASTIAFGGLSWAMDGAAAPVAAVRRLGPAMRPAGALRPGAGLTPRAGAHGVRLTGVRFHYPRSTDEVFAGPRPGTPRRRVVGRRRQNGAGKTTLAKLLCRLYEPTGAQSRSTARRWPTSTSRRGAPASPRVPDFVRFELSLRDNVDPGHRATDEQVRAALADAGADHLGELHTPLSKSYAGGTDLSGGQWQRVALARALCAVRRGAGLVLLDEPTAQLDVRGEAEIFRRILAATRGVTTVLVSHRFSTVRHADRICVLEHGRVIELGTHDELMALGGRTRTMFELQAQRFADGVEDDDVVALVTVVRSGRGPRRCRGNSR